MTCLPKWPEIEAILEVSRRTHERWAKEMYHNDEAKRHPYRTRRDFLGLVAPALAGILTYFRRTSTAKEDITWDSYRSALNTLGANRNRKAIKIFQSFSALREDPQAQLPMPHPKMKLDCDDMHFCDTLLVPSDAKLAADRFAIEPLSIQEIFPLRCIGRIIGYPERFGAKDKFLVDLMNPVSDALRKLEDRLRFLSGETLEQVVLLAAFMNDNHTMSIIESNRKSTGLETFEYALRDCQQYFRGASISEVFLKRIERLRLKGSDGHAHVPGYRREFCQLLTYVRDYYWEDIEPIYSEADHDLITTELGDTA